MNIQAAVLISVEASNLCNSHRNRPVPINKTLLVLEEGSLTAVYLLFIGFAVLPDIFDPESAC